MCKTKPPRVGSNVQNEATARWIERAKRSHRAIVNHCNRDPGRRRTSEPGVMTREAHVQNEANPNGKNHSPS
jgi:hypothetical protein